MPFIRTDKGFINTDHIQRITLDNHGTWYGAYDRNDRALGHVLHVDVQQFTSTIVPAAPGETVVMLIPNFGANGPTADDVGVLVEPVVAWQINPDGAKPVLYDGARPDGSWVLLRLPGDRVCQEHDQGCMGFANLEHAIAEFVEQYKAAWDADHDHPGHSAVRARVGAALRRMEENDRLSGDNEPSESDVEVALAVARDRLDENEHAVQRELDRLERLRGAHRYANAMDRKDRELPF